MFLEFSQPFNSPVSICAFAVIAVRPGENIDESEIYVQSRPEPIIVAASYEEVTGKLEAIMNPCGHVLTRVPDSKPPAPAPPPPAPPPPAQPPPVPVPTTRNKN